MEDAPEVVLVSNRGPVSFVATDDGFQTKRGAGGLAGAVDPVARRLGDAALWIAATTSDTDRSAVKAGATRGLRAELGYRLKLLEIAQDRYSRYYDVVSNRMLWFANHCLWEELGEPTFGRDEIEAWDHAYQPVNRQFAEAVADAAPRESLVLFQDYHLATAPRHLRRLRPQHKISHFTHSSFCGPEGLERLPAQIARQIVEGMLGADLVGFHIGPWSQGFMTSCERIGAQVDRNTGLVRHQGSTTWVRCYPIPIDAAELRDRASRGAARRWAARFGSSGTLIARADRTEPSKNIVRGFQAFGLLLDRRPDLHDRTRFVACLYPSRESMPEYRAYIEQIVTAVDEVNARFPGAIELFLEDDFDRTLGALLSYDVLLVNPLMDGMNLVSKEGPALNENWGTLVLSRRAGSFDELGAYAVEIPDPRDLAATAAALEAALDLPQHERRRRAVRLRHVVEARKPEDWIEAQIADLRAIGKTAAPASPPC